jgi:ribosome-binding protein aMBF1 (putative translation factor)
MNETYVSPKGIEWAEYKKILKTKMTPEEINEVELRTELMTAFTKARNEKGITRARLSELSGVKPPIIARTENGENDPQLTTLLKMLSALGKKLQIVDAT